MVRATRTIQGGIDMERLTQKKQPAGYDLVDMQGRTCDLDCRYPEVRDCSNCVLYDAIQKLAHYEDLEEQGLLLKLLCKVGDEVFVLIYAHGEWIQPFVVSQISILKYGIEFILSYNGKDEKLRYWSTRKGIEDINSIVFLTKEEAEAKLKDLQNGVTQSNDGVKEGK